MIYLIFDAYETAYIANATISLNMRLTGNITQQWAEIRQRNDGKYVLLQPASEHMTYVTGYTDTEEYQEDWFNSFTTDEV